ncbi:MAG: fumarylacetoacetate hydrolase family protein [Pseudomonadota bacterium]
MKIIRLKTKRGIVPAAIDAEGRYRDLSSHLADLYADLVGSRLLKRLSKIEISILPVVRHVTGIAPVLGDVRRMFCIGRNYKAHAEETGSAVPEQPFVFMKVCPPTGAEDPIMMPKTATKLDYEVELAVVIGARGQHLAQEDALNIVAGYTVLNDVSERVFQKERGGQFVKGKSSDSFAPLGPWFVTADEVPDPQALQLWTRVNGEIRQDGRTADMIFPVAELIAHISEFITLEPGDVIATGTPDGVGAGMTPPGFLNVGDQLQMGITGLGEQNTRVVAYSEV